MEKYIPNTMNIYEDIYQKKIQNYTNQENILNINSTVTFIMVTKKI